MAARLFRVEENESFILFRDEDRSKEIQLSRDKVEELLAAGLTVVNSDNGDIVYLEENLEYEPDPSTNTDLQTQFDESELDAEDDHRWSDQPTRLLLDLYPRYKKMVEQRKIKTFVRMWREIEKQFRINNFNYTATQIQNKFKGLERRWKKKTENNKRTGRGRATCPYDHELNEIFAKKKSVFPEVLLTSAPAEEIDKRTQIFSVKEFENETSTTLNTEVGSSSSVLTATSSASDNSEPPPKKQKGNPALKVLEDWKREFLALQQERNKQKSEAAADKERRHKEKIEITKKKLKLLETYLEKH